MPSFATIENNIVTALLVAESKEQAQLCTLKTCVEYDPEDVLNAPTIGLTYSNGVFEQPEIEMIQPDPNAQTTTDENGLVVIL